MFPFFWAVPSTFAYKVDKKGFYMIKTKFQKSNMGIKNAKFDADFEFKKKNGKKLSMKKW